MSDKNQDPQIKAIFKFKIVFVGDQSVGKTSIINRFIFDQFTGADQPTVGIDFISKTLNIDNKTVRLQLWDTAGQERFRSLIPSYIRDSQAVIVVYDITNKKSFENIDKWINFVKQERNNESIVILLGNKLDIEEDRQVSVEDAESVKQNLQAIFKEVSAKSGQNIQDLFTEITENLINLYKEDQALAVDVQNASTPKIALQSDKHQPNQNQQNESTCSC